MPVGTLQVDFVANIAKYVEDMGKGAAQTEAAARRIENAFKSIAQTLGVGLSVAGLERFIAGSINAQAELGRLATRAGTTVEELSGMRVAAHEGGVGLDEVAVAMTRLSKAVFEGQDNTTKAAKALDLLGLKAGDLAKLPTGQALQAVAVALDRFKDSAGKTGVQMEILGRSGAGFGAFLTAYAQQGPVAADVTTQMANAAREAEAKLFDLTDTLSTLRNESVNQLVPALNSIVEAFAEMAKESEGNLGFWHSFGEVLRLAALGAVTLYTAIKDVITSLHTLGQVLNLSPTSGHFAADIKRIFDESDKSIEANTQSLLRFYDTAAKGSTAFAALAGTTIDPSTTGAAAALRRSISGYGQGDGKRDIGRLPIAGGADDPARKLLEAALAALKAYAEQEKAVLANRNQYLQASFDRGDVSLSDYFTAKQAAQDEDLARTTDSYRKQIALIDDFIKHAATLKDKAQGEKEKVAAQSAQTLAIIQAAGKSQQIIDDQIRAATEYRHTLDEVDAKMLELQGDTAKAASIRFDDQNEALRNRLAVEGDTHRRTELDLIGQITVAQAALNETQLRYSNILGGLSIITDRIDLAQQTGRTTELGAINSRAAAAQAVIGKLTEKVDEYAATVEKLPDGPVKDSGILRVEQMRLEIDKLAATSDVLAAKFRDAFEGPAATFITDLISGTKTAKQAFLDMAKSIEQSISQIAAKNIAETLFGKGGALGGIPEFFAGLFGGSKGTEATGAAALTGSAATLTAAGGVLGTAGASLIAAAGALGASSVASSFGGGSAIAGNILSMLGDVPFFAGGTDFAPGGLAMVGEQGKELVNLPRGSQVIPNHVLASKRAAKQGHTYNTTINLSVAPGASRASAEQAAAEVMRAVHRAQRIS